MKNELEKLRKSIRQSLMDGEASMALDRLHTFTTKKIRSYCLLHNINISNEKGEPHPLHSLIGMLIKYYSKEKQISDFSIQALKQSISIFERFNEIRNNRSFAHDNIVLSNEESLYVVNCIINMMNFLNYIETGESQLISSSIVSPHDVYKYICLNYGSTTKQISEYFSIPIDEMKDILLELFRVENIIRPATMVCIPDEDECQWTRC